MPQPIDLQIKKDPESVADAAAQLMLNLLHESDEDNNAGICLSGGNTPRLLYQKLAQAPFAGQLRWKKIHWFWGDERYVPQDNTLSNYRMWHEAMSAHASAIPPAHIHRIKTELPAPQDAAGEYEEELRRYYADLGGTTSGAGVVTPTQRLHDKSAPCPLFLITLLGLGTDGHTASLFPGTAALNETTRWVAAVEGVKQEARITLTYPALNLSRHVIFLVTGAEKREMLQRLLDCDLTIPAAHVTAVEQLHILADQAAAAAG